MDLHLTLVRTDLTKAESFLDGKGKRGAQVLSC